MFGFGGLARARFFRRTCHIATLKQFKVDVQLRCHAMVMVFVMV